MRVFRHLYLRYVIVYLTAMLFLNLSFLRVEVAWLNCDDSSDLIENIAFLLSSSEEERESGETEDTFKEVDLLSHESLTYNISFFELSQGIKWLLNDRFFYHSYLKKFNPPPES